MFIAWPSCFYALWLCRRLTMGPALGASQEISLVKACGGPPPASRQMAPLVLTHLAQQPLRSRLSQGFRIYSRKQVTACCRCRRTRTQSWQWRRQRYPHVLVTYLRHSLASDAFTCGFGLLHPHCHLVFFRYAYGASWDICPFATTCIAEASSQMAMLRHKDNCLLDPISMSGQEPSIHFCSRGSNEQISQRNVEYTYSV